ncbi:hypothetical protein QQP08_020509 [Theobroma cacao]|nr:hypothetical protein QQP08_020509 [Theobroma cacao]
MVMGWRPFGSREFRLLWPLYGFLVAEKCGFQSKILISKGHFFMSFLLVCAKSVVEFFYGLFSMRLVVRGL